MDGWYIPDHLRDRENLARGIAHYDRKAKEAGDSDDPQRRRLTSFYRAQADYRRRILASLEGRGAGVLTRFGH